MASERPAKPPLARSGATAVAFARRCIREAGRVALQGFRSPLVAGVKGRGNIVTETDYAVERFLHGLIESEFPEHRILSEESRSDTPTDGWVWVIDPIDGTKNFSIGIPLWCINLALCLNGETQIGITYDPVRREEFLAVRGRGLRVHGQRAHASTKASVMESVIGVDLGFDDARGATQIAAMASIWPAVQAFRNLGSAALGIAYAACGRLDLFVHNYLFPWDLAPGLLLVTEGGGSITDRDGGPARLASGNVICGGRAVHADFLRVTAGFNWRGD